MKEDLEKFLTKKIIFTRMQIDLNLNSDSNTFVYKDNVLWGFTASLVFSLKRCFQKDIFSTKNLCKKVEQNTCATKLRKGG